MIPVEPLDLPLRPLVLTSVDATLAPPSGEPTPPPVPPLAGRVLLGGPHAVPITPEFAAEDRELRLFVSQEAARAVYHLVRLTLNFPDRPVTPRLHRVDAAFELTAQDGAEAPVAWSMTPSEVRDARQRVRHVALGPRLAFLGVEVELGEWSRTVTEQTGEPFLQAQRAQTPRPGWRFTRTRAMPLTGDQSLAMVVRAPAGVTSTLGLEIRATTRSRPLGLRRYREVPGPLTLPPRTLS
ncbi:hypothetical protein [Streptomyces sp. B6B3]|uniref:hypothetical protein n=1 Tax=Streptomyces sp. B6B3 TaxID=3153570 RepID=UPI00325D7E1C